MKRDGVLMVDIEAQSLSEEDRRLLSHPLVCGVILFARNAVSCDQVQALCREIRRLRPELLIAVDQEGGRVQRLRERMVRLPANALLGKYYLKRPAEALQLSCDTGWLMASEVLCCGLDFSFAPVLDLDRDTCSAISDRSFSPDVDVAVPLARAYIQGMHQAGMAATGKHFPGHGQVVADSHFALPVDDRPWEAVLGQDLLPFSQLSPELDAVMPAHIVLPSIDADVVSVSPFWLQTVLRTRLQFRGVVVSDDLSMQAASAFGPAKMRAERVIQAGCDIALVCNDRALAESMLIELERGCANRRAGPPPLSKLAALRRRRCLSWEELESTPRRAETEANLRRLQDEFAEP